MMSHELEEVLDWNMNEYRPDVVMVADTHVLVIAVTVLALSALAACVDTSAMRCGQGYCPTGLVCETGQCVTTTGCGNGIESLEEACDDGNLLSGDGCSDDCRSDETCGNGYHDAHEACDDGNQTSGDGCSADCQSDESCGNEYRDVGEICDDGNLLSGDGCSADCQSDESCGNEYHDAHEICDDGNQTSGDGCSADCRSDETCGNWYLDSSEICDDGNQVSGDGCRDDCQSDESCGNGIVDVSRGEECDCGADAVPPTFALCAGQQNGAANGYCSDSCGQAPVVEIRFPPPTSLTYASTIKVRGTAFDGSGVAVVRINDLNVPTVNSLGEWEVSIPLQPGINEIVVESEDMLGHGSGDIVWGQIERRPPFRAGPLVVDTANGRILTLDETLDALVAFDSVNGGRTILSDDSIGTGPGLEWLRWLALDSGENRTLSVDISQNKLIAIDLNTGDRTVLYDGLWDDIQGMVLDASNRRVLFTRADASTSSGALVALNLQTGALDTLSDDSIGTGDSLSSPGAVTLDPVRGRAIVNDASSGTKLVAIELSTGNRTVLYSSGDDLDGMALDVSNGRVLLTTSDSHLLRGSLIGIDLNTGTDAVLSDDTVGTGPGLIRPEAVAVDHDRALVVDSDALVAVQISTGDRAILLDRITVGAGPRLRNPGGVVHDTASNRILVVDSVRQALVATDLNSGDRTILSWHDNSVDSGEAAPIGLALDANRAFFVDDIVAKLVAIDLSMKHRTIMSNIINPAQVLQAMALDPGNDRAFVMNDVASLAAIDLSTRHSTILSDSAIGTGPILIAPEAMAMDASNDRVLITDSELDALVAVELSTGNRTILADAATGAGPDLSAARGIALDASNGRAIVIDSDLDALVAIDLGTGNRTILSDAATGPGPNLSLPLGITLDAGNNRAFVVDSDLKAVFAIDLLNGTRVIISYKNGPDFI